VVSAGFFDRESFKRTDRQLPNNYSDRADLFRIVYVLENQTDMKQAPAILMSLLLTGCGAGFFSAKTKAIYEISPDGKKITYISNKEQQGLMLDLQEVDGKVKSVKINVDKSGTAEQAIAAALAVQIQMNDLLQKLLPLLEKAAMTAAVK